MTFYAENASLMGSWCDGNDKIQNLQLHRLSVRLARRGAAYCIALVTQPMMQRQPNQTELRLMDSYIQNLCRFQKCKRKGPASSLLSKVIYSEKVTKFLTLTFDCMYRSQKLGEDFAKFSGLPRTYEL